MSQGISIAVIGDDDADATLGLYGVDDTLELDIDGLDSGDDSGHICRMSDHVWIGEIDEDEVSAFANLGDGRVGDAFSAHFGRFIVSLHIFATRDKHIGLTGKLFFATTIQEIGGMCELLGLGDACL